MKYAIGCDIGGSFVKVGLLTEAGQLTSRKTISLPRFKDPEDFTGWVSSALVMFARQNLPDDGQLSGAGIGIPGPVKYPEGTLFDPPNLPFSGEIPFGELLRKRLPFPAFIDNDATVQTLGEARVGKGRKIRNFIYIALGTGIGGGIVVNGRIYRGDTGMAGEVGHLVIDYRGRKCLCGSRGCMEAYASINGIVNSLREFPYDLPGEIRELLETGPWGKLPGILKERIERGEKHWQKIWNIFADALGAGMGSLINIFNPEKIIISGGLSYYSSLFLARAIETARHYSFKQPAAVCEITVSKLKENAGIYGAGLLVFEEEGK